MDCLTNGLDTCMQIQHQKRMLLSICSIYVNSNPRPSSKLVFFQFVHHKSCIRGFWKVPFSSKSMFYEDEIVQGNCDAGEDGVTIMTRWLEA